MTLKRLYNAWISPQRWLGRLGVRAPMQLVIGLTLLTACVLLFSKALRLVPDGDDDAMRIRAVIAEMASSRVAASISNGDFAGARRYLDSILRRYDEVLSAGLRREDGSLAIQTNQHDSVWGAGSAAANSPTHIRVPMFESQRPWGQLELSFKPAPSQSQAGALWSPQALGLPVFILAGVFLLFWVYLSRMLQMLDPSAVVPDRMQLLMDTLVEGVVILDPDERIVMCNQSFRNTAFSPNDRMIGRPLSSLPWSADGATAERQVHPWIAVQQSNLPHRGVAMTLKIGARHTRHLNVNASPIFDPNGARRGVLVTFNDQTVIESDNLHLARLAARFGQAGKDFLGLRQQLESELGGDHIEQLERLLATAGEMAQVCDAATADASDAYPDSKVMNDNCPLSDHIESGASL